MVGGKKNTFTIISGTHTMSLLQPDSLVIKFAPELRDEWLTLRPFMDVIKSYSAGPQPESKFYDKNERQYISLDFSVWKDGDCIIPRFFKITAEGVTLETYDGEFKSSLRQLHDFLRQLPRDPEAFAA